MPAGGHRRRWRQGISPARAASPGLMAVRQGERCIVYVNSCPHIGTPLDWTPDRFLSADGRRIVCATHGAEFQIADGLCIRGPCHGDRLEPVDDPDQGRHHLRARTMPGCEPAVSAQSPDKRKQVHARYPCSTTGRSFRYGRRSPPRRMSARRAIANVRTRRARPGRVLGGAVAAHRLDEAADQDQEHQLHRRRLDQVVRGRHAERLGVVPRPASRDARRRDGDHLGRRRSATSAST